MGSGNPREGRRTIVAFTRPLAALATFTWAREAGGRACGRAGGRACLLAWSRALGPRATWPVPGCLAEDVSLLRGRLAPSGKNRFPPVHLLSPPTTDPSPRPSVVSRPRERVLCPTRCRSARVRRGFASGAVACHGTVRMSICSLPWDEGGGGPLGPESWEKQPLLFVGQEAKMFPRG